MYKLLLASLLSATLIPVAEAADPREYSGWSWSGNIDHIGITKEVANRPDVLVGTDATAIGFAGEYFTSASEMTYTLGFNYLMYNDNNEFEQYVHDWYGSSYQQSDASAMMLYAEAGPRYRFGARGMSFFTARAGVSGIFASSRSISNCSNCYSEDINIDGGLYGVLGVGHNFGNVDISLQFQQYITGDLDNSLRLKFSTSF